MFNIGFTELVILAIIGILVVGPEQLPELARKAARLVNDLKRVSEDIFSPVREFKDEAQQLLEKTRHEIVAEAMNMKNKELEKKAENLEKKNEDLEKKNEQS